MTTPIQIDFEQWNDQFQPIINIFDDNASFDDGDGGVMFETYGDEMEFVLATARSTPLNVWTYVDGDEGTYVINGLQYVNRIGYFVTHKPAEENTHYEVVVSRDSEMQS